MNLNERVGGHRIESLDDADRPCVTNDPVVGFLRLRQRDGEPLSDDDFEWFIDRLGLVLDMARHEAEQRIPPATPGGEA